jgi:integrase
MAGRPLSAHVHENRDGSVTVRLPAAPGSTRKVSETFPNSETGARWRAAALAARKAGLPLPDAKPYCAAANRRAPEELLDGFADVAWAWWAKFYPSGSPNPQRGVDVAAKLRLHLIPFFAPLVDHIGEITYEDCEDFVDFMAGIRGKSDPKQTIVAEARELTLAEAAEWCNKSKSGVRKAWLTGKFANGHLDTSRDVMGVVRIPIGDLIKAGFVPLERGVEVPTGFSKKEVSGMLNMLRNICKFAIGKNLLDKDPSTGIEAKDPDVGARTFGPNSKSTSPVYMFDLATSKRIASRLHIHHQMTFWLLRCVGLRISEAYGVTLQDIYRNDGNMTIRIWRQGGKNFLVRDAEGKKKIAKVKTSVKTTSSARVLPIAKPVAELIDHYIEAFHEGEADSSTPLLCTPRGCGQAGFRDALEVATIAAGCGLADVGFKATPHTHRKYFATDMADVSGRYRSVYMGHKLQNLDGGAAITEDTYTVRRKGVEHLLVVAEAMTSLIETSLGGLVEPVTAGRLLPTSVCPNPDERGRALDVLDDAGYVCVATSEGEQVLEVAQVAELLAVSESKVRQLVRDGQLVRQQVDGAGRIVIRGVTVSSVEARVALSQQLWTRAALCTEFSLTYNEVDSLIRALGVKTAEASVTRGYCYDPSEVDKIRRHLEVKTAIRVKAAPISEVMDVLRCSRRTAQHLLNMGRLAPDKTATASLKITMVTRSSLERLKSERVARTTLPQAAPAGTIPIREAQVRTGLDRTGVLQLKSEGVIIHRTSDYQFHIDDSSLSEYLDRT